MLKFQRVSRFSWGTIAILLSTTIALGVTYPEAKRTGSWREASMRHQTNANILIPAHSSCRPSWKREGRRMYHLAMANILGHLADAVGEPRIASLWPPSARTVVK
jgi:hypothetical protein